MQRRTDGPPIARFVLTFMGMLAAALCLAALSPAAPGARQGDAATEGGGASMGSKSGQPMAAGDSSKT